MVRFWEKNVGSHKKKLTL